MENLRSAQVVKIANDLVHVGSSTTPAPLNIYCVISVPKTEKQNHNIWIKKLNEWRKQDPWAKATL